MKAKYDSNKIANICEFMRLNWYQGARHSCSVQFGVSPAVVTQIMQRKSYARYTVQYEQGLYFDLCKNKKMHRKRFLKMAHALEAGYSTPPPPKSRRRERGNTPQDVYHMLEDMYSKGNPITVRNSDEKSLLTFRCYNKEHLWWLEQKNNKMLMEIAK